MKNNSAVVWIIGLTIIALGTGLVGGLVMDRVLLTRIWPAAVPVTGTPPNFSLLEQAWNIINKNYVDRPAVQLNKLEYGAINGMVDALGDTGHTRFLTPEMVKSEQNFTQGQFEGIGAEVQEKDGQVVIVAPIDGSPAQKAGLAAGDIILKVNGADMQGKSLSDVVSQILGPAGTKVSLTILHPASGVTQQLTLTRAKISVQNVSWSRIPGTDFADVRVIGFSNGVTNDLKKALADIQGQGLKGIVLDLRNNPGGLLDECVATASLFLKDGNVLQVKDAKGKVSNIAVKGGGTATSIPMTVLINQGTASAAEIVSGALQDYQRAKLVGDTTFGTGTVLETFPLSDGSALLLATQEWLTPKGRVIWHNGIQPDLPIPLAADVIPVTPIALKGMTAGDLASTKDLQFTKTLDVLNGSFK